MKKSEFLSKENELYNEEIAVHNKRLRLQHEYEQELLKKNGYDWGQVLPDKHGNNCMIYGVAVEMAMIPFIFGLKKSKRTVQCLWRTHRAIPTISMN
jgi:hypothetical protein